MGSCRLAARVAAASTIAAALFAGCHFVTSFPSRISVVPNLQVDAAAYDAIASTLSKSLSVTAIPALQPPGFVAFLAAVYALAGHSWVAGRLALWGCLAVVTVLSALMARRLYEREAAAWVAALLCASSPALTAYAGTLQYELLTALLWTALVGASVWVAERSQPPTGMAVGLGFALGLAILVREVSIVLVPVIGIYLYARGASKGLRRRAAAIAMICTASAMAPPVVWSVVQSTRTDRLVTISDKGPLVMAFGNNPAANGTFNAPLVGTPEPAGWAFIRAEPVAAARLWMRKALYFWGLLRDGWNVPRPSAIVAANAMGGLVPLQWLLPWARGGWLLLVFLVALASWRRRTWRSWWVLPTAVAAIMAVHVVSISSYRFAVPVLPLILTVAAGPLSALLAAVSRSVAAAMAVSVLVCAITAAQFAAWPLIYELPATDFDGVRADNRNDPVTGERLRFAPASGGRRPVLMLVDEYLPAGSMTAHLTLRADDRVIPDTPVLRVFMATMEGKIVCDQTVSSAVIGRAPTTVSIACSLNRSGPATFIVETLGVLDVSFTGVRFAWDGSPAS